MTREGRTEEHDGLITIKSVDILRLLFRGEGYRDMPFVSEEFRKSKIACFGVLENFIDGEALQLFENAFLLTFGEGIEDDTTVRKNCEGLFQIFEDFTQKGYLFQNMETGTFVLFKFEIPFVSDYTFLIKDFETKQSHQKQLSLSKYFDIESFFSNHVLFTTSVGRGLVSDITTKAIAYDNDRYSERVTSHKVYKYFLIEPEEDPTESEYNDFLKLFDTVYATKLPTIESHCYQKWILFKECGSYSIQSSPTMYAIHCSKELEVVST